MSQKQPTGLQQAIQEAIDKNQGWNDEQIAKAAYSKLNPGQEWPGKNPTAAYVKKMRRRMARKATPPRIEVEEIPKDFFKEPEHEAQEAEEPEEPFDPLKGLDLPEEKEGEEEEGFDTSVEFTDEDLNAIIGLPFSKLAAYTGYSGWRLDPEDPDDARFIQLSNKIAHKYVPGILEKYGLEVLWGISLLGFVGDRMAGYKRYKAEHSLVKKAQEEAPTPAPAPAPASAETQTEAQLKPGQLAAGEDELKRRLKKA